MIKLIGNVGTSATSYKPLQAFSFTNVKLFYLHILIRPFTCGEFSSQTRGQHELGDVEHVGLLGQPTPSRCSLKLTHTIKMAPEIKNRSM